MLKTETYSIFVTCPKGLNYALESELLDLGLRSSKSIPAGVKGEVDHATLYKILLWSRIANRVVLTLVDEKVENIEEVYQAAYSVDWMSQFSCDDSFVVSFTGASSYINNSEFGALKIKDAIVDKFRDREGIRPSVDRKGADIRITAHLAKGRISVGIDLAGESLHKRGYRAGTGKAPLKENLAAGILRLSGWPHKFESDASFIDPMCGSGTLLIEAAMMAFDKAPGLEREKWGFTAWRNHNKRLWDALLEDARQRFTNALKDTKRKIVGFDQDGRVVSRAWDNIQQSGFEDVIHVEKRSVEEFVKFEKLKEGLILTNPPYGERLGTIKSFIALYQSLGQVFGEVLIGWNAGIFTGNIDLGKAVGWRSHKQYKLYNGAIESKLILIDLELQNRYRDKSSVLGSLRSPETWKVTNEDRAKMFENRIQKNIKQLSKWAKKSDIDCYRLYDADMPEFSVAVDLYQSIEGCQYLHVQEYQAPKSVNVSDARERLSEALCVLKSLDSPHIVVEPEHISLKQRSIQKGLSQYDKADERREFFQVREGSIRTQVNLFDYLDTGLFLDHRPVRRWIFENAKGKRFLNLFCYTGVASLHAIAGGAKETVSVDMSKTYLDWYKRSLSLNGFSEQDNAAVQADCMAWLAENKQPSYYDLIFLDPPTFSNSKRMSETLDIQRDQESLIEETMNLLNAQGELIFSNNLRSFKLSEEICTRYEVNNISAQTFDKDFTRNQKIHQVWSIKHR